MVVQVVVLSANGEARQSRITSGEVSIATVTKLCRKTRPAAAIGTYEFGELTLTIWGWTEGKAGTENKHALPVPLDEEALFGDVVVSAMATADEATMGFTVAMWEKFCKEAASGSGDAEEGESDEEDVADGDGDGEEIPDDLEEDVDGDEEADTEAPAEEDEAEGEAEEEDEEEEEEEEEEDEEDGDEADGEDGDCYEDGDEGGGGKRRAPRKRTTTAPEYRRFEMGLKSHIKVPMPVGKRAPRWQTAPELVEEGY